MISFGVDDVVPAGDLLPTRPLRSLWPEAMAIGGDPALPRSNRTACIHC